MNRESIFSSGPDTGPGYPAGVSGVSSGSGDIILSSPVSGKKSKKWVILVILAVLVLGAGAAFWFYQNYSSSSDSLSAAINFMRNGDSAKQYDFGSGDEDDEVDVAKYNLMAIKIKDGGVADIEEYYATLEAKVADSGNAELKAIFKVLSFTINQRGNLEAFKEYYGQNGYEKTVEYIESETAISDEGAFIKTLAEKCRDYYLVLLEVHDIYAQAGCLNGGDYSYQCAMEKGLTDELSDDEAKSLELLAYINEWHRLKMLDTTVMSKLEGIGAKS